VLPSFLRSVRRDPLVLAYYLPGLILSIAWGLLTPVLPLYAKALGASYGAVGLVLAGEGLGLLIGDVPAGMLINRLGTKRTMLLGLACVMLATTSLSWAPTVWVAMVLRILSGVGHALFGVTQHAYIAGAVSLGGRGRAIALQGGITRMGGFLGPLAGGAFAAALGLRATFLLFGATSLAALTALAVFLRAPATPTLAARSVGSPTSLWAMIATRYRELAAAGIGQLLAQMIRNGRSSVLPLYAADVVGLQVSQIGLVVSLSSAIDMSLFYPAGWLMDHLGRKYAILPSFLIQALGMFLLPFTHSFGTLLAAAMLVALGNGIGSGSMMTLGADLAPKESRGEFLGLWRLIGDAGTAGGPIVVGQVADLVTLPMAAWALAASGLCAALVFGLLVPETHRPGPKVAPGRVV
jgi:MFS family permease